jgi:hypothetical protein
MTSRDIDGAKLSCKLGTEVESTYAASKHALDGDSASVRIRLSACGVEAVGRPRVSEMRSRAFVCVDLCAAEEQIHCASNVAWHNARRARTTQ